MSLTICREFVLPGPTDSMPSSDVAMGSVVIKFIHAVVAFFRGPNVIATLTFVLLCHLSRTVLIGVTSPFLLSTHRINNVTLSATRMKFICNAINIITLALNNVLNNVTISHKNLHH